MSIMNTSLFLKIFILVLKGPYLHLFIYPADIWVDPPTCDVSLSHRAGQILKPLVMANPTHTWWYNKSPLKNL